MADRTEIAWCDSTFNPWIGCTKVSPGCDHCYAAAQDKFRGWTPEGWGGPRKRTSDANWRKPLQWNGEEFFKCNRCGHRQANRRDRTHIACVCGAVDWSPARRRVFCSSLADVFDNQVPVEWRRDLFDLIGRTPNLDWLLLTKRIGNAAKMLPWTPDGAAGCHIASSEVWPNVWIGATVVNQEEADRDIPKLLATPARVRFLSMEPLLGPVNLARAFRPLCDNGSVPGPGGFGGVMCPVCDGCGCRRGVHWVIVGGESGHEARPMHPDWARSLRDQCAAAGVPFLFKQWGEWATEPDGGFTSSTISGMRRIGKKAAGRLLDGVTHDCFPEARHA